MPLTSIDPTPNPNAMKLSFDRPIDFSGTVTAENKAGCPRLVQDLYEIEGVEGIFVSTNFMSLTKKPDADWEPILKQAQEIFEFSPQDRA